MAWFRKDKKPLKAQDKRDVPGDVFDKCQGCGEILYRERLAQNLNVCPNCAHHVRISSDAYLSILLDSDTFEELDAGLRLPADTKVVDKATTPGDDVYSAFEGTELAAWLRERGVTRLAVGGLATEYCVLNTAADAIRSGFEVLLVEDAIRAIDDADGRRAVEKLREMGATITDSHRITDG